MTDIASSLSPQSLLGAPAVPGRIQLIIFYFYFTSVISVIIDIRVIRFFSVVSVTGFRAAAARQTSA